MDGLEGLGLVALLFSAYWLGLSVYFGVIGHRRKRAERLYCEKYQEADDANLHELLVRSYKEFR